MTIGELITKLQELAKSLETGLDTPVVYESYATPAPHVVQTRNGSHFVDLAQQ